MGRDRMPALRLHEVEQKIIGVRIQRQRGGCARVHRKTEVVRVVWHRQGALALTSTLTLALSLREREIHTDPVSSISPVRRGLA